MQGRDRILIIEDDPAVGESLRDSLTSNGFHAEWKASGGEGIRHAQSESQDLVILDGRLPDGSGFDFFRQMRQMRLQLLSRMRIMVYTVLFQVRSSKQRIKT